MLKFSQAVKHYPSSEFSGMLKQEIEQCERRFLPLEHGATQGGYVSDEPISVTVLRVTEQASRIQVRAGIFFTEIVICCGCGVDPMPVNAYCEMCFDIDRLTAETAVTLCDTET